jgi:hypothetical protein
MVALNRDIVSGEPRGIHRTALRADGLAKRLMPDGMPSKMTLGPSKGAAIMLGGVGAIRLGIAEGIETALSAAMIFNMPVWSVLSASGVASLPIIHGVKFLHIFADHDKAGISAARRCWRRYEKAGIGVEVRYPPDLGTDWNDYLRKENPRWVSN